MNRIQSKFTNAKRAPIAAAILATVLAFAGTIHAATNPQTEGSTASSQQMNAQTDSQGDVALSGITQSDQSQRPEAMGAPQTTNSEYAAEQSKPSTSKDKKHAAKAKALSTDDADEYVCTPDTPTTSAACDLP